MILIIFPWRLSALSIRHQLLRPSSLWSQQINALHSFPIVVNKQQVASEWMYANYLYVNNHLKNLNNSMSQRERHSHSESVSGDSFYIKSSRRSIQLWIGRFARNEWKSVAWGGWRWESSLVDVSKLWLFCCLYYIQQFELRITIYLNELELEAFFLLFCSFANILSLMVRDHSFRDYHDKVPWISHFQIYFLNL